jgi:hypothetical protein
VLTHVEFRSNDFPPFEDEDYEVNAGRYGKRLAQFLSRGLNARGIQAQEPIAEDWGWVIPIRNDQFRLWIGCGNYFEYEDGFLCFISPHTTTVRRFPFFRKIDTSATVAALREAIDQVLATSPDIRNKRWWTHAEFNAPRNRIGD